MARINEQLANELKAKEEAEARRAKLEAERAARLAAAFKAPVIAPAATPAAPAAPAASASVPGTAAASPATATAGVSANTPATIRTAAAVSADTTAVRPAANPAAQAILPNAQPQPNVQAPAAAAGAVPAAAPAPGQAEQRLALVIGNSSYKTGPLTNPVNDARAMAVRLQQLGFAVVKKENASREEMMTAVRDFGTQLANGGVGLFYYAGHGVQSKGTNFLVPVDADIRNEDELSTRAYNANEVLEKMDSAKNRINVVILDACRDNPFARSFRSGARGLAGMDQTPSGTLVAYATSPGSTASDGTGANGLYTEQLLQEMAQPGVKLEDVFKRVRVGVKERSEGKQLPWEMSSVTGDFYFNPTPTQEAEMAAAAIAYVATQSGTAPMAAPAVSRQPQFMPVLVSRKLIEQYQLNVSVPVSGQVRLASFSPNGEFFLLGGADRNLRLWRTATGLPGNAMGPLSEPSATAHGESVAGLGADGRVALHELNQPEQRQLLDKLPKGTQQVFLSPDGRRVLALHPKKGLLLFKRDTQDQLAELDSVDGELRYAFSPDSKRLITWGTQDSTMKLWDTETGKRIERMTSHWHPPALLRFSASGQQFVTVAAKDKAIVWRVSDGEVVRKIELPTDAQLPKEMELLNNGAQLMTYGPRPGAQPNTPLELALWDVNKGTRIASLLPAGVPLKSFLIAEGKSRLFVNGGDNQLYVFDLRSLQRIQLLEGMEVVDLSADQRRFLVRNGDEIRLMDVGSMTVVARLRKQVTAFAAAKGRLFATSTTDGLLTLWDFDTAEQVGQLKGHLDTVQKVIFSDDGRRLASFGADNTLKLWALSDVQDRQQLMKDQFESTAEYVKRMGNWSSPYTALVTLDNYNADSAMFNVRLGDLPASIPLDRDAARKLVGQRQAMLSARLKFFDSEQMILGEVKIESLPATTP
jgi:WD40 repeat protein